MYHRQDQGTLLLDPTPTSALSALPVNVGDWTSPPSMAAPATVAWSGDVPRTYSFVAASPSEEEQSFDQRVALKLVAADFSAYLEREWRAGLFRQLDNLLDADEWDFSDKMPSPESFKTFLRMVVHNGPVKRPSLGATSNGRIIASWASGRDRLTIECLPDDTVRWVLTKYEDGERSSNAGTSPARRLREYLAPYHPETWFGDKSA